MTEWGSCDRGTSHIWFNLKLAKKQPQALEYIPVHEMRHFLVLGHGERFIALMNGFLPDWRARRDDLNAAPLTSQDWKQDD